MDRTIEIEAEQIENFRKFLYEQEKSSGTVRKYITDVHTFFRYLGKDREVNKQRVIGYKEWLRSSYSINSVNSMLAALNQFLHFLECDFLKVKRIRVQKNLFLQEQKELTKEEYHKLVNAALKEGKCQLALCMETIASTGIRISELEFLTVEALKRKYIEIYNKGKYRRIFLPCQLKRKLLEFARNANICEGPVFVTRNGRPKNRSNIWREMKALQKKAGIDGCKIFPHNLRHLFARVYYKMTKDLSALGDLLGHSSLDVTRIYISNTGETYQRQLDAMKELKVRLE